MANTTLKERLDLLMVGKKRGTKAALARFCKVKEPSVADWFNGKTKTLEGENLLNAAKFFNVSPEWLATGKGPRERLSTGEVNASQLLGEPITNGLAHPPSQPLTLDSEIIHEALILLRYDERNAGEYTSRERADRITDLYSRVAADGGRLTREHNAEFVAEVKSRAKGESGGQHLARHRTKRARA